MFPLQESLKEPSAGTFWEIKEFSYISVRRCFFFLRISHVLEAGFHCRNIYRNFRSVSNTGTFFFLRIQGLSICFLGKNPWGTYRLISTSRFFPPETQELEACVHKRKLFRISCNFRCISKGIKSNFSFRKHFSCCFCGPGNGACCTEQSQNHRPTSYLILYRYILDINTVSLFYTSTIYDFW